MVGYIPPGSMATMVSRAYTPGYPSLHTRHIHQGIPYIHGYTPRVHLSYPGTHLGYTSHTRHIPPRYTSPTRHIPPRVYLPPGIYLRVYKGVPGYIPQGVQGCTRLYTQVYTLGRGILIGKRDTVAQSGAFPPKEQGITMRRVVPLSPVNVVRRMRRVVPLRL